jgi:hypothetical protein
MRWMKCLEEVDEEGGEGQVKILEREGGMRWKRKAG